MNLIFMVKIAAVIILVFTIFILGGMYSNYKTTKKMIEEKLNYQIARKKAGLFDSEEYKMNNKLDKSSEWLYHSNGGPNPNDVRGKIVMVSYLNRATSLIVDARYQ